MSAPAPTAGARRPGEALLALVLLAGSGLSTFGLLHVLAWRDALRPELGTGFPALVAVLVLAAPLGIAAAWVRRARARREGASAAGALLRFAFLAAVLAYLFLLVEFDGLREPYVSAAFGLAAGALGLVALLPLPAPERWPRAVRRGELLLFALALGVLLAELGLRAVDALVHPRLLADTASARAWIDSRRIPPGTLRFGFPFNSLGHYDREPPAPGSRPLVVVVGDSFGVGTVSQALHYTSRAEELLGERRPGLEVYNLGIAGTDPSHYLEMLRDEALPLRPDLIVLGFFVGNDLVFEPEQAEPVGFWRSLVDRGHNLSARLVVRSTRILAERAKAHDEDGGGGAVQGEEESAVYLPQELSAAFPWYDDPLLELPTFSREGFERIERERALDITQGSEDYTGLPWILRLHETAAQAGVRLFVLLIPDEFQVEDDVWSTVLEGLPAEQARRMERERPQRVLAAFLAKHGIPFLDLLPALRAVEPMADGRRHLYHFRDTHWNKRGNQVAGRELARVLDQELGPP